MLMGSCTSMGISLNAFLAELNNVTVETSSLDAFIMTLKGIRGGMAATLAGVDALIQDMEAHRGEQAAKVFGVQSGGSENN